MKKITFGRCLFIVSASLAMSLVSCGPSSSSEKTLDPEDFQKGQEFIKVADLPPNPLSESDLKIYHDLGLNTCQLTEDFVNFTDDGSITSAYSTAIKTIGKAGLDVWIRNMYNDPDYFQNDVPNKAGSNYGTPYVLPSRNITTELQAYPEITGYYMADEPFMTTLEDHPDYSAMDQLGTLVDWHNQYTPSSFFHMNMVPSQSYDHYVGHTYAEFIQYYIDNIVDKLSTGGRSVCLDRYPFQEANATGIASSYLSDILTAANLTRDYNSTASEEKKATFGICLQTFKDSTSSVKLKDIQTSKEVTFQQYVGMACGAQLFEYFTYRTLQGFEGILDKNGEKRIYDYVKDANSEVSGLEPIVSSFDWSGIITSPASEESLRENSDGFDGARNLVLSSDQTGVLKSMKSRLDAVVGCFCKDGQDGYLVVNYSAPVLGKRNIVKMSFQDCTKALVYQDGSFNEVSLLNGDLQISIEAGGACFVIPA